MRPLQFPIVRFICGQNNGQDVFLGMREVNTFDFTTNSWQALEMMTERRWYPTNTTLLSGKVLVTSGAIDGCVGGTNNTPDVSQNTPGWRRLTGAVRVLPLYPMMFAAPNGKVFNAGPNTDVAYLDASGTGAWTSVGTTMLGIDKGIGISNGITYQNGCRESGTAVMYQPGKVLLIGGEGDYGAPFPGGTRGGDVTNTTELIDLNLTGPQFRYGPPMQYKRTHVNSTLLPDGSVLVTGGSQVFKSVSDADAVLPAELWTPPTAAYPDGRWTTMAAMQVPRLYHSTAVLLPDGRVLSAGGGNNGNGTNTFVNHPNAEIFSPPYLLNPYAGVRPTLTSAPAIVGYGQPFAVATPAPADVARVTLVRLASVTHSFDQNQRFLELAFSPAGSGALTVTAPVNANCPPGQYLLFLLDASGLPSVGRVITIDVNACPPDVSFTEEVLAKNKCSATVRITASGSNLSSSPQWFLNNVLQNVPAGQLYLDINFTYAQHTVTYGLKVTPACGGVAVTVEGTSTQFLIPCTPSLVGP